MTSERKAPAISPHWQSNAPTKTMTEKPTMASVDPKAVAVQRPKSAKNISNTAPELSAAAVLMKYGFGDDADMGLEILLEIQEKQARLAAGNLSDAENMLMAQAVALQGIFVSLATVAKDVLKEKNGIQSLQTILGLALRAQSGSRATLQALGDLKFPRQATFIRQANVSNGNQQVNNGITHSRTEEIEPTSANELSGSPHELLQNTRPSSTAIAGNPQLATVGKVHRAKVRRRQVEGGLQRDQARRAVGTDARATARDSDASG